MAENRKAGWYRDPRGTGECWWNGIGWSETIRQAGGAIGHSPTGVEAPRSRIGRRLPVLDPQHPAAPIVYSPSNPAPQVPGTSFARRPAAGYTIDARGNQLAFASVAAGIVGLFMSFLVIPSLLAVILALVGLSRARRMTARGEDAGSSVVTSWVGLALGGVGLALGVGQLVLFFTTVGSMLPPGLFS